MAIKTYPTVDEASREMTFTLGLALTQWHLIEHKLYQFFVYLCGDSDIAAINAIFHEMSFETKMTSIRELIRARNDKSLSAWEEVAQKVFKDKSLRDKLAHWTVGTAPARGGGYVAFLSPPITDPRAITVFENVHSAIDSATLQKRAIKFGATSAVIHRFMMDFPEIASRGR